MAPRDSDSLVVLLFPPLFGLFIGGGIGAHTFEEDTKSWAVIAQGNMKKVPNPTWPFNGAFRYETSSPGDSLLERATKNAGTHYTEGVLSNSQRPYVIWGAVIGMVLFPILLFGAASAFFCTEKTPLILRMIAYGLLFMSLVVVIGPCIVYGKHHALSSGYTSWHTSDRVILIDMWMVMAFFACFAFVAGAGVAVSDRLRERRERRAKPAT